MKSFTLGDLNTGDIAQWGNIIVMCSASSITESNKRAVWIFCIGGISPLAPAGDYWDMASYEVLKDESCELIKGKLQLEVITTRKLMVV